MEYIAYLHKDSKSDYGVSFPDFPGCITAGSSLDEARRMAAEALAFHIAGLRVQFQGGGASGSPKTCVERGRPDEPTAHRSGLEESYA